MRLSRIFSDILSGGARVCVLFMLAVALLCARASAGASGDETATAGAPDRTAAKSEAAVPDTVYTVPPIVVEAPRIARGEYDVFRRSGFVAVLELGDRKDRVEDLASLLSRMVGVQVREYGGLGSFATVSIRGSSSNQVDLYLDGMPVGDAYTGAANLGDLPLGGVDHVEVYRGFSPPHLGSSAIGGVINLRTAPLRPHGGPAPGAGGAPAEARLSYGSFGTSRYAASLWPSIGKVRAFLHGSFLKTRGDFTYLDDRGTPENPDDDANTTRINNDSETMNAIARVEALAPVAGKLSLAHHAVLRETGVPGIGSDPSAAARSERTAHRTVLEADPDSWFSKRLDVLTSAYTSVANEKFHDPEGEVALARQDTDNAFRTYGGTLRSALDLRPVTLELFFDGKSERFRPRSNIPAPTEGPDRLREAFTTVLSADVYADRLGVVLTYTERFHSYTSEFYDPPRFPWLPPQPQGRVNGDRQTSQYGLRWVPASFLTVKANWGEYYRLPTFLELFGNTGSVTGSFDLEPESGVNRDIGAVLTLDRVGSLRSVFLEAVYLDNEVENLILFFPNSQFTSRPQNIGAARIRGFEASFSTLVSGWLRLAGNYAYLDGKDTGPIPYYNGNELPGRPRHDLAASVDLTRGAGRISYEYHRLGENCLDPANLTRVPARNIHNVALRWSGLVSGLDLTVEGRNLANDRVSDVSGFPLPGRSYFATLSYRYHGGWMR